MMRKLCDRLCVLALIVLVCASATGQTMSKGDVSFSMDQVDIRSFVKLVGGITGKQFIVDDGVKGKVTVVYPRVPAREVFPVFESILESVGCGLKEERQGVYRVIALPARETPSGPVIGPDEEIPPEGVVTKIIRLVHVRADELIEALESRIAGGKAGALSVIETTNHIIVTDTAENVRRIQKIVTEVDKPGLARTTMVLPLKYVDSGEVADQLTRAMAQVDGSGTQRHVASAPAFIKKSTTGGERASIVAAPHSNSLILVGTSAQIGELTNIVAKMDVDLPSGSGRLSAIFLKYIGAEEAAKSINALLAKQKGTGATKGRVDTGKIAIQEHVANNALLIDAMPRDFELVRGLVDQLDVPPEQVLVEVLIAEISLTDAKDLGVSFFALDSPGSAGDDVVIGGSITKEGAGSLMAGVQAGLFPDGLSLAVSHGASTTAEGLVIPSYPGILNIDAIKKDGRFDILSNVPILAQNNREAAVSIVENIPMLKSTIMGGSGTARDVIQNIERVDVGIELKLTPHVNPNGDVMMMLNPSIGAIIDPGAMAEGLAPTIARREVSTTVSVPDGETIVLSGLIRQDVTESIRRVPILGSIPLLGWLFRHTVTEHKKSNLMVFVTPHVVTDRARARDMTSVWEKQSTLSATNLTDRLTREKRDR